MMLAAVLSLLSYVPFEWVAKLSLLLCACMFIVDPFPPLSRLVALVSLVLVAALTKLYRQQYRHFEENHEKSNVTIVEQNDETLMDEGAAAKKNE